MINNLSASITGLHKIMKEFYDFYMMFIKQNTLESKRKLLMEDLKFSMMI